MVDEHYVSLAAPIRHEIEIKRSRFIACLSPAPDDDTARSFVAAIKREFHDARHCPSAYLLGARRVTQHSSDDGEPAGTAGAPMIAALSHHLTPTGQAELSDVVAVVVRYFGGIKLGAGGLNRAYGGAVTQGLERSSMVAWQPMTLLDAGVPLTQAGKYEAALRSSDLHVQATRWEEGQCVVQIAVRPDDMDDSLALIASVTSGAAHVIEAGQQWVSTPLSSTG